MERMAVNQILLFDILVLFSGLPIFVPGLSQDNFTFQIGHEVVHLLCQPAEHGELSNEWMHGEPIWKGQKYALLSGYFQDNYINTTCIFSDWS